jgi:transposase
LAMLLAKGPASEIRLAPKALDLVCVPGRRGRPRKRFGKVIGDRAYDGKDFRREIRRRGAIPCIPKRAKPGCKPRLKHSGPRGDRRRFVVERTISWINKFRRVAVRYDHSVEAYEAFVTLALIRIALRKFRNNRR